VSDNGPQLTSEVFKKFCVQNAIKHITIAPFHPPSNGLAERFVQTFKTAMKKNVDDGLNVNDAALKFLATYRTMPNAQGLSPAQLLHGRPARTVFSQMFSTKKHNFHDEEKITKYSPNQPVYIRNYSRGEKWIKGIIDRRLGKMMYVIKTDIGFFKRHQNQMKSRLVTISTASDNEVADLSTVSFDNLIAPDDLTVAPTTEEPNEEQMQNSQGVRRSGRIRRQVQRYQAEDFRH